MKNIIKASLKIVFIILLSWSVVCSFIYRIKHPEMTETQLLLQSIKAITLQE